MSAGIEIVPFARTYSRDDFRCGNDDLDRWLREQASQQERAGNTRTFLAIDHSERVVGYYSTAAYRLEADVVAGAMGAGKWRYPKPAVLLARLAVDEQYQGAGLGGRLLVDALIRVVRASQIVGIELVVVHAIDQEAAQFYQAAGFIRFADHDLHLYLPLKYVRSRTDLLP